MSPDRPPAPPPAPGPLWRAPAGLGATPRWVRDATFYEIFPDRFARSGRVPSPGPFEPWEAPPTVHGFKGGDLYGIAERLDDLVDLGIDALYLTPIFTSAANHRYHTDDYLSIDPLLGGDDAFGWLRDVARAHGVRLVLDGVFNHTGRGHGPFVSVLENLAASPYRGWYHFDGGRLAAGRPITPYAVGVAGDAEPEAGAERRLGYRAWWDLPALPKLNHADPAVREFLYRVGERWIARGIDGWRLDVPEEITEPGFWQGFRERVRAARSDAYLCGEVWTIRPDWTGPGHFDGLMNYPLGQALLGFCAGPHLDPVVVAEQDQYAAHVRPLDGPAFAERLREVLAAYPPEIAAAHLNLVGSHDTPRFRTMAGGDRASYALALLLLAALPGAPCIYYGDELGMEGRRDPDCRRSYPADRTDQQLALRAMVRWILALRKRHRVLRADGDLWLAGAEGQAVAILRGRQAEPRDGGPDGRLDEAVVVAVNAAVRPAILPVRLPGLAGRVLVEPDGASVGGAPGPSHPAVRVGPGEMAHLELPPRAGIALVAG